MKQKNKAIDSGNPFEEYSLERLGWLVIKAGIARDIWAGRLVESGVEIGKVEQQNEHME